MSLLPRAPQSRGAKIARALLSIPAGLVFGHVAHLLAMPALALTCGLLDAVVPPTDGSASWLGRLAENAEFRVFWTVTGTTVVLTALDSYRSAAVARFVGGLGIGFALLGAFLALAGGGGPAFLFTVAFGLCGSLQMYLAQQPPRVRTATRERATATA